ncbi:hypothetical protein COCMIDRAFT_28921 [Bipolaris oryzae ATCC 44560]|uniref:non-specific serine/threonine protein kinase n=1 Tax=Bipolaris oryzae ATCC 44560 TaxID=930090 RepID=W6ZG02_COCMI|nr:uncharacterized protein COCMIDRAFT_28921 [Bipolaris oryzae ATCC 44560]EUC42431.1 hypothetical protein COCMIDRAFT_28921 [Bipolaris oryzae ATCC 44560]
MPYTLPPKAFLTLKKLTHHGDAGAHNQGIYLTQHLPTAKVYIEKRLLPSRAAKREILAMRLCNPHPHLVSIFTSTQSTSIISIYMQHCELGSLDTLILHFNAHATRLHDEGFVFRVFWHLALALCYLSTGADYATTRDRAFRGKSAVRKKGWHGMVHRDIKPGNVFLTRNRECKGADAHTLYPCVVLGDFGCVGAGSERYSRHARVLGRGDPRFEAPEREGNAYSDVFSVGLVLHCLARMVQVPDENLLPDRPLGGQYTGCRHLAKMVRDCLKWTPEERPSPLELPRLVFEGYRVWRQARGCDGVALPKWAFG